MEEQQRNLLKKAQDFARELSSWNPSELIHKFIEDFKEINQVLENDRSPSAKEIKDNLRALTCHFEGIRGQVGSLAKAKADCIDTIRDINGPAQNLNAKELTNLMNSLKNMNDSLQSIRDSLPEVVKIMQETDQQFATLSPELQRQLSDLAGRQKWRNIFYYGILAVGVCVFGVKMFRSARDISAIYQTVQSAMTKCATVYSVMSRLLPEENEGLANSLRRQIEEMKLASENIQKLTEVSNAEIISIESLIKSIKGLRSDVSDLERKLLSSN